MCANPLENPPYSVDSLILLEGSTEILDGSDTMNVTGTPDGLGVELLGENLHGWFTTRPIRTEFEFNEAIPSWNGIAEPGAGFRVLVRVRTESGPWSPWIEFGNWGTVSQRQGDRVAVYEGGHTEIDILFTDPPSRELQFRVELYRQTEEAESPRISLLAFSFSNTLLNQELWERLTGDTAAKTTAEGPSIDLPVPYRSQKWEDPLVAMSVCSPTSVAMILEMLGIKVTTAEVSEMAYDPEHEIYGNWSRNVQAAAQLGARGYIDRFRSWHRVRSELENGRPVVASIRFERGELESPPYPHSTGHLLVVRGFTAEGEVITNDPLIAEENKGDGCLWRAEDLAKAWFDHGGVGYVLSRP